MPGGASAAPWYTTAKSTVPIVICSLIVLFTMTVIGINAAFKHDKVRQHTLQQIKIKAEQERAKKAAAAKAKRRSSSSRRR
ncbi:hypothetical protein HNQ39_004048 [Armatimonas rosea]|uniref:Uncharacterized protein n=1 Tax=Armatimonas rosea TaxID=685828 RepID=A0A7W9SSV2_ARMRO|nr:hypothetical protein [Armatimonas rosea]